MEALRAEGLRRKGAALLAAAAGAWAAARDAGIAAGVAVFRARGVRTSAAVALLLAAGLAAAPTTASGQAPASHAGDGVRIGLTFGGISTIGLAVELYRDSRSLDFTIGTWGFRDIGISAVVKQYFGGRAARPFLGAGLWLVTDRPPEQRTGLGLVARVPVGVDWRVSGNHSVGAALSLNRALAVRRPNPADQAPLNKRIVPLPGLYYRWRVP